MEDGTDWSTLFSRPKIAYRRKLNKFWKFLKFSKYPTLPPENVEDGGDGGTRFLPTAARHVVPRAARSEKQLAAFNSNIFIGFSAEFD